MTDPSPKLCECGCGEPAPIAQRTSPTLKTVRGEPQRFVLGHHGRLQPPVQYVETKCLCGCGSFTYPVKKTKTSHGQTKGQAAKYLPGHRRFRIISTDDYTVTEMGYNTPCWIWNHCLGNEMGHGKVTIRRRKMWAHRAYWIEKNGQVPQGLELDHLCRNPSCVRPDHLEPVTHQENLRRGNGARMTPELHARILELRTEGLSHREIANIVGLGKTTIGSVLDGSRWADYWPTI